MKCSTIPSLNLWIQVNISSKKGCGLLYHVADLYFEIVANYCIEQDEEFDFHKLEIFENLLRNHQVEHFRHHIISQVYGKYKAFLVESFKDSED